jgi:hypothetical protein
MIPQRIIPKKTAIAPPMSATESVSSGRRLIHVVDDGDERLHRFDCSAFIGVHSLFPELMWGVKSCAAQAASAKISIAGAPRQTCVTKMVTCRMWG